MRRANRRPPIYGSALRGGRCGAAIGKFSFSVSLSAFVCSASSWQFLGRFLAYSRNLLIQSLGGALGPLGDTKW